VAGTVIEVLRRFLPDFLNADPVLSQEQSRALGAIRHCRTQVMGGEVYACPHCGERHFAYHSCNHKACPQCGRQATQNWVRGELDKRVHAPYFMVNFTLPSELRGLFFGPTAVQAFNAFFSASSKALAQVLARPKWLGATVSGFTGALHTWNQRLLFHPHIHYLVPGAGLDAKGRLVVCKDQDYLAPVSALRRAFVRQWRLHLKELEWRVDPVVWRKEWGVYIKPFGTGVQAIKYLGAYVRRTAIGDRRILDIAEDSVLFSWKDRSGGNKTKTLRIEGVEFIRRYLRHVLPKGLRSVRYYGFCHPAAKKKRLLVQSYSAKLLILEDSPAKPPNPSEASQDYPCPRCGKPMEKTHSISRYGKYKEYRRRGRAPPDSDTLAATA
jgi:hypothetical protein